MLFILTLYFISATFKQRGHVLNSLVVPFKIFVTDIS